MCIQITNACTSESDQIVYKAVLKMEDGTYRSLLSPGMREPQATVLGREFRADRGTVSKYKIGETQTTEWPGFYCFMSFYEATHYAVLLRESAYGMPAVLRCKIPSGTNCIFGYGDTVAAETLEVLKEVWAAE